MYLNVAVNAAFNVSLSIILFVCICSRCRICIYCCVFDFGASKNRQVALDVSDSVNSKVFENSVKNILVFIIGFE